MYNVKATQTEESLLKVSDFEEKKNLGKIFWAN